MKKFADLKRAVVATPDGRAAVAAYEAELLAELAQAQAKQPFAPPLHLVVSHGSPPDANPDPSFAGSAAHVSTENQQRRQTGGRYLPH